METIQLDLHYLYHVMVSMFLMTIFSLIFLSKPIKKLSDFSVDWIEKKMSLNEINREKFNSNIDMVITFVLAFSTPILFLGDLKHFKFEEMGVIVKALPFGETTMIDYDDLEFVYMFDDKMESIPNLKGGEDVIRIRLKESSETVYYLRSRTNSKLAEKYYPIHTVNPHLITTANVHKLYQGKFAGFVNSLNYEIQIHQQGKR